MYKILLLTAVSLLLLAGCADNVSLTKPGKAIHTDWKGQQIKNCKQVGKITVSAKRPSLFVDNKMKIRDELEVMARNEAAKIDADTVSPLSDPVDGHQRWGAYQCQGADNQGAQTHDGVQVFPIDS